MLAAPAMTVALWVGIDHSFSTPPCTWGKDVAVASEQLVIAHNANGELIAGMTTIILVDIAGNNDGAAIDE